MIRKLLIGAVTLVALFAVAGAGLFFAEPTSAQTTPEDRFGDRDFVGRDFGDKGPMLEKIAERLGITVEELQAELDAGQTIPEIAEALGVDLPHKRGHGGKRGAKPFAKIDHKAVVADALGITVEALEAAREAGTKLDELAEANGTTMEEVQAALVAATVDAVNQAVADGDMTQEQADIIVAHIELKQLAQSIFGKEDGQAAVAATLGITVEELEAARAAGTKLDELAEANGTTIEAVKEAVQAARDAAIEAAVADGTLTAEQGEQLLNGRNHFGGKRGHRGRGGFGPAKFGLPLQGDA